MLITVFGLCSFLLGLYCQELSPVVETTYGSVQGLRSYDIYLRMYDGFLGIPYGSPPLNDRRFQKALPPDSWEGVYEADHFGDHCFQLVNGAYGILGMSTNHSEDCLYLNVYIPKGLDLVGDPRPVMVYYYGGGYIFGTQEMYPPHHLANFGDVIVVNFDYRLSVFGFLSTGDAAAPGNYALWDAHLVLQWVQANIAAFGGDPNRVTIFGQSAGAGMVSLSMASPQMTGLFQGAIAMSGGSTGFLGTDEYTTLMPQYLGDIFSCDTTDSQELIDCLRFADGEDLLFWGSMGSYDDGQYNFTLTIRPVVDGEFITEPPRTSFENGVHKDINFISGNCKDDAAGLVVGNFFGLPFLNSENGEGGLAETKEDLDEHLRNAMLAAQNKNDLVNMIVAQYPLLDSDDMRTRTVELSETDTDWQYAASVHMEADLHADASGTGSSYRYVFSYDQSFLGYPSWVNGSHTDDMYSLFGEPYLEIARILFFNDSLLYDDTDRLVSDNIMAYFANFAYTFDPNSGPNTVPAVWPTYDTSSRQIQTICPAPFTQTLTDPVKIGKFDFWNNEFYQSWEHPNLPVNNDEVDAIRFNLSEEEILSMVAKYKIDIHASLTPNDDWAAIEERIDEFVERRTHYVKGVYYP